MLGGRYSHIPLLRDTIFWMYENTTANVLNVTCLLCEAGRIMILMSAGLVNRIA